MDVLMQVVVTAAFAVGVFIVAGLCLFFVVLPYETDRDGVVLDRDEDGDTTADARWTAGRRT